MPSLVSILTPSFNREDLVAETLDSVIAQTWPHWEMLVVDDGSTDRTKEIVASYAARDSRIRLLDRTWQPKGACSCRNEGVSMARGDYVMFLDTDDLIDPWCLDQRVAAMDPDPELDFAIFPGLMFETVPHDLGLWWNVDKPQDELTRQFRLDPIAQGTGVLWRKEAFVRVGMWDQNLRIWQDVELFLRAYIRGYRYRKFFDLAPDLHNRVSPNSLSRGAFFSREKQESKIEVVRRTEALLHEMGKQELVPELRFITASIIFGAARSRLICQGLSLLNWASSRGVFRPAQTLRLATAFAAQASPLANISLSRSVINRMMADFATGSTVATIPVSDTARLAPAGNPGDHPFGGKPVAAIDGSRVSVVIPAKNGVHTLRQCLEGILDQTVTVGEIIVIDSGSSDGSLEIIADFPQVRLIEIPPETFDHGGTRNLGVAEARGEFVVMTVQDARAADEKWLERMLRHFDNPEVVAVGGAQVVPHEADKNPIEWYRPVSIPKPESHFFADAEAFNALPPAKRHGAYVIDNVTSVYRRDFLVAHPFQRTMYAEDIMFAVSALRAGKVLVRDPRAIVYHYHQYDYGMMVHRTVVSAIMVYDTVGRLPVQNKSSTARLVYRLAREKQLSWITRFRWLRYNLNQRRAVRDGVRLVLNALDGEPAALQSLRAKYCGSPPIPENSRVKAAK